VSYAHVTCLEVSASTSLRVWKFTCYCYLFHPLDGNIIV